MSTPPQRLLEKAATWFGLRRRVEEFYTQEMNGLNVSKAPSITIARDPGSGGHPIAIEVAGRLGMKFYDEALIDKIAKSTQMRREVIRRVDERTRSVIDDIVHSLLNPDYVSDVTYVQHLVQSTLAIGHEGNAVILGRGSNFILSRQSSLDVLITAPYQVRVERAIQYEGISHDEARDRIAKITNERKGFVSDYFGKDYTNSNYYDLIINTEHFDIESAAKVITYAFRKKFPTWKEKMVSAIRLD